MIRKLLPLLFLSTSAVYATEDRCTHTFQAVECDDRDHSFTLVPVYFGTFFASPEVEVSAISNSKLIFSDPPGEWNVIARHGIEVEILGTGSSETVVVIGVEKLGKRDDLWCLDDLIVKATVEAIKCTMRDTVPSVSSRLSTANDAHVTRVACQAVNRLLTRSTKLAWTASSKTTRSTSSTRRPSKRAFLFSTTWRTRSSMAPRVTKWRTCTLFR